MKFEQYTERYLLLFFRENNWKKVGDLSKLYYSKKTFLDEENKEEPFILENQKNKNTDDSDSGNDQFFDEEPSIENTSELANEDDEFLYESYEEDLYHAFKSGRVSHNSNFVSLKKLHKKKLNKLKLANN